MEPATQPEDLTPGPAPVMGLDPTVVDLPAPFVKVPRIRLVWRSGDFAELAVLSEFPIVRPDRLLADASRAAHLIDRQRRPHAYTAEKGPIAPRALMIQCKLPDGQDGMVRGLFDPERREWMWWMGPRTLPCLNPGAWAYMVARRR